MKNIEQEIRELQELQSRSPAPWVIGELPAEEYDDEHSDFYLHIVDAQGNLVAEGTHGWEKVYSHTSTIADLVVGTRNSAQALLEALEQNQRKLTIYESRMAYFAQKYPQQYQEALTREEGGN